MIEIEINKEDFINYFLNPIKKVNVEGNCSLYAKDGNLISISSTVDKICTIYAKHTPISISDENFSHVHITDIKRLILALRCIDSETVKLNIDGEKLFHDSKKFKFSTYLLDDKYVTKIGLNPDRIDEMEFATEFTISKEAIKNIKIAQMIAPTATKIYFYTENGSVFANLNDKVKAKIDNASLLINDTFEGVELSSPLIISGEVFKLITQFKDDVQVKIQKRGIMVIEVQGEHCTLKYITSALVK